MPAHEDSLFGDAEVQSVNRTIMFTDLLTIPFKKPPILSLFQPIIPLRQKNPRLSVLLLLFMVIKTQPTDSNKHAE